MERAAAWTVAHQRVGDLFSQVFHQFADARRGSALSAFDRQKSLGHGDGDFAGFETDYRAVASNDMEIKPLAVGSITGRRRGRVLRGGFGPGLGGLCGLHEYS